MTSVLLQNGLLLDGTGSPPFSADLLMREGIIAEIGKVDRPAEAEVFNCEGLAVAPGFIDGHSHSDLQVLENRQEKLLQGVTTEVVGNCGFSAFPAPPDRTALQEFANGILCGSGNWGWTNARSYLDAVEQRCLTGVVALVGHGTLRVCVAGHKFGLLEGRQIQAMAGLLDEALSEGAAGLSTGLMYSPGAGAPLSELERLCGIVARRGKTYATHIRSYSDGLIESVEQQLTLARRTGCRLQISHFQAVGPRNWHKQQAALERIELARDQGVDVAFDCYPYTRGSTVLTQLLPQWALDGGVAGLLSRLHDSHQRQLIAREAEESLAQGWDGIIVEGRSIAETAAVRGRPPVETMLDLLVETNGAVTMLEVNQSEENLRQALTHPLSNVISDGFYTVGRPHPRLYGAFPFWLGQITRDRGWLSLPNAVHKITDLPAHRFGLRQTGRLAKGFDADVTIFNPQTIGSQATYENPDCPPTGIQYVFRRGRLLNNL